MRAVVAVVSLSCLAATGCATLPTTVHNPTAGIWAGEVGPLSMVPRSRTKPKK